MRIQWFCMLGLILGMATAGAAAALADSGDSKVDQGRIDKLIQQLGSRKFAERARARLDLDKIGEPALSALQKAAKSEDAEVRRVAGDLVKGIEGRLQSARLLAPKRVHVKVKDMPVLDALAELSKQSGYPIDFQGDRAALAQRKITLDTGETTFWEAFDQLCQKGGLVEAAAPGNPNPFQPGPFPGPGPFPVPPAKGIRIQPAPAVPILPVVPPAQGKPVNPQLKVGAIAAPAVVVQAVQVAPGGPVQVQIQAPPPAPLPPPPPPAGGQGGGKAVAGKAVAVPGIATKVAFPDVPGLGGRGNLTVQNGKPTPVPTCYAGAIRIRAIAPPAGAITGKGETHVYLEITAEPRINQLAISGDPQLKKAVDDLGQSLAAALDAATPVNPVVGPGWGPVIGSRPFIPHVMNGNRQTIVILRLKAGEKKSKTLKELSGTLSAQTLSPPQTLLKVDNIMKAGGQKAKGEKGGSLEVVSIAKEPNGDYKVQVRMESPPGLNPFGGVMGVGGGAIQIQIVGNVTIVGGGNSSGTPVLQDAKGKDFQLVGIPSRGVRGFNGNFTQELTLVFRPQAGQGEPASLVLTGQSPVHVVVPFRLENVPLP
jgi:hypothetical protein